MPDFRALIAQYPDATDEELLALARGGSATPETGPTPSFLKRAWDWGNAPLVDLADDTFGESAGGRFATGLAESMTSPLSLAGLALSGGATAAGKAGLFGLSRGARAAEAALNVPYLAEGLSTLAGADSAGEAVGGGLEAALAGWGLSGALRRPTAGGGRLLDDVRDSRIWNDQRGSLPLGGIGEPDLPYEEMVQETLDGGGASRFLDGRSPSQGAMVGGVVPPQTLDALTPEALAQFALRHRSALEAAPNRTLGAFADKGAFDLDVSENVGGLEEALRLARDRGEKSVFDLGTFETYPNPAHPDTATHWQELQHRSKYRGLTELDPEFQGRGQAGDERARRGAWPQDYVARTFWNTPESLVEGNIAKLPQQYTGFVPKAKLLDQADPLYRELEQEALARAAAEGNTSQARVQTILERLIKDHPQGFAGMKLTETMDPAFTQPVAPEWLLEQTILPQSPMEREPYVSLNRSARFMRQPTSATSPMIRQEVQTFGRRPVLPESVIRELREAEARDAAARPRAVGDSAPTAPGRDGSRSATTAAESAGDGLASPGRVTQDDALRAASDSARRGAPALLAAPAAMDEDGELDPIQLALASAGLGVAGMGLLRRGRRITPPLNAPYELVGDRLLLSTRVPTGKAARSISPEPSAALFTGLAEAQTDPGLMAKLAQGIAADPLLRGQSPDAVRAFTEAASRSIGRLIDMVPEDYRRRSAGWYEGAHRLGNDLGARIGVSGEQGAGLLAIQSPSKDWNQNIEIANRLGRWWRELKDTDAVFTQDHFAQYADGAQKSAAAWIKDNKLTDQRLTDYLADVEQKLADVRNLVGTRFEDLPDMQRAQMIRAHSELVEPQGYSLYTPEGDAFRPATTGTGEPGRLAWQSYPFMAAGLSILEDGSPANISAAMGMGHKVRSFFNNINVPADPRSVTVDTHNVAGAHFRPLGGSSPEVRDVMGATPSSAALGIRGKHAIYRDAVAMAAAQRGLRPSQAQSISWEGIKGLFSPTQKRDARFKAALGSLFDDYQRGRLSEADLYDRITALAGGFTPAEWALYPPAPQ